MSYFDAIERYRFGDTVDPRVIEDWCADLGVTPSGTLPETVEELRARMKRGNRAATRALGSAYRAIDEGDFDTAYQLLSAALDCETAPFFRAIYERELAEIPSG